MSDPEVSSDDRFIFVSGGIRKRDVKIFRATGEKGITILVVVGQDWVRFLNKKDGWIQLSGPGAIGGLFLK